MTGNATSAPPLGIKGQWFTVALALIAMVVSTIALDRPPSDDEIEFAEDGGDDGGGPVVGLGEVNSANSGVGAGRVTRQGRSSGGGGSGPASGGSGQEGRDGDSDEGLSTVAAADCNAGRNDGATEKGVTANEIKFAATTVKTGVGKSFLSDAEYGIEAMRQKVNSAGGICGREITVKYQDDGWVPQQGLTIIKSWISSGDYFGLAVNPSSEGLRGAIESGDIDAAKFPVVGADGMLQSQYTSPWVWPVATSTASVMRIMVNEAADRGASKFGIVWENNYRFGVEGHDAFKAAVAANGKTVTADVGIPGGQNDYSNAVNSFLGKCGGTQSLSECDFIAYLLEPATAAQWKRNGGFGDPDVRPRFGRGAPQPLFLDSFANDCASSCQDLYVWTSFKPPLDPFDGEPAVAEYRADLNGVSSTAEAVNPHVEGAYVGMDLLVTALGQLGPAPTREKLKTVLDQMVYESGLGPPLDFKTKGKYAANSAQAYKVLVNNDSFAGWRYADTGFLADPKAGF